MEKTVVLPQLHLLRNSLQAAHELRWGFSGPGTQVQGRGRVHRDTTSIIRCNSARGRTDSLRYLLKHAIELRKVLEEEERMKEEEQEKEKAARSSASSAPKRTRKKRRKRKLLEAYGYDAVGKGSALALRLVLV